MKILFVHEWCGWFGGVEQNIADTVAGLREAGHQSFLAYRDRTPKNPDRFAALFDGSWRCPDLGPAEARPGAISGGEPSANDQRTPVAEASFAEILQDTAPDTVYLHKVPSIAFLQRSRRPRTVRMVHDHDLCCPRRHKYFFATGRVCSHRFDARCLFDGAFLEPAPGKWFRVRPVDLLRRFCEMRRNRGLDALLVGSRFMRDELLTNGFPAERVRIIPPVVRMPLPPEPPPPGKEEILYVGQLIRGKGVDLLLRALPRLSVPWRLTVIGEGNARAGLERLAADLGLGGRVKFLGWIPRDDLGERYSHACLSVVPSRWPEPFGMVGLEAMLYARPVVAFAVGGIPDWLEDGITGYAVPEQDLPALAGAIDRILGNPALAAKLGAAGRRAALERFSFPEYLGRLTEVLRGGGKVENAHE